MIGRNGGMIKSLKIPFWLGLGGAVGSGTQILPWIHLDDLCNLIKFAVENEKVKGVINGVAPDIITNADFTKVRTKRTFQWQQPWAYSVLISIERSHHISSIVSNNCYCSF